METDGLGKAVGLGAWPWADTSTDTGLPGAGLERQGRPAEWSQEPKRPELASERAPSAKPVSEVVVVSFGQMWVTGRPGTTPARGCGRPCAPGAAWAGQAPLPSPAGRAAGLAAH